VPIIAVLHGTDASVAWKVMQNGFANLSLLDEGYYGSGMYFTSSATYALPYYATKKKPALIVCFLLPGNPLPVIEKPKAKDSYLGKRLRSGYQSHYVCVRKDGMPCKRPMRSDFWNEIVVDQESQVLPGYLVEFDSAQMLPLAKQLARELVEAEVSRKENLPSAGVKKQEEADDEEVSKEEKEEKEGKESRHTVESSKKSNKVDH